MLDENGDQAPEESLAEDDLAELRPHVDRTLTAEEQALVDRLDKARARVDMNNMLMERELFVIEVLGQARRDWDFCQLIDVRALKREVDEQGRLIDIQRGQR